jgi:hypothetical protein
MRTTLTALIHGDSGVGKSWLAASSPGPRLILDAEGRAKYAPSAAPKIYWDPKVSGPPASDGTWDTCICPIADFDTLSSAFTWLRSGQHHFQSIVIDSLMEAQKRCIDAVAGTSALDHQDWGTLLRRVEALVRGYRDLTLLPNNTASVVLFIVGTVNADGKQRPLLQGQFKDTVPYYMDVVGYYFKQPVVAEDGVTITGYQRSLLVDSQPGYVAKDGTGQLVAAYPTGVVTPDPGQQAPSIARLMELLDQSQRDGLAAQGGTAV